MRSVPPAPVPALSNFLADLAERAGAHARAYRRGSVEAIADYMAGAALLLEARPHCRRGTWLPFIERAGIGERAAQDMLRLARVVERLRCAGVTVTAEHVHDAGGIRAWLTPATEPEPTIEKPAPGAGFSVELAGDGGADMPLGGSVSRSEPFSGGEPVGVQGDAVNGGLGGSEGRTGARVAPGRCRCGREAVSGRRQCERCLTRDRNRTRSRLAGGRYAAALDRRLREAAATGRGLNLSPADVEGLVNGKGRKS